MNDEEKKEKLRKYLITVDRLKIKCDDAARWESMSFGPSGEIRSRSGRGGPDEIKETAIQLRQECEMMAVDVRNLRQEMEAALASMEDDRLRGYLENKYIHGMSEKDLCKRNSYSERHMRRLMSQAMRELNRCSTYFS
jgi:hypothetical protein